jgi:hypothetical protein
MSQPTTTIKVTRGLRDRLAAYAHPHNLTLAQAISQVLDVAEERDFWSAVVREHAGLSETDRAAYVSDAALADDLADEADANLSRNDAW